MTAENFAYWLKGYFEILEVDGKKVTLTDKQIECINTHLGYVFNKPVNNPIPQHTTGYIQPYGTQSSQLTGLLGSQVTGLATTC